MAITKLRGGRAQPALGLVGLLASPPGGARQGPAGR